MKKIVIFMSTMVYFLPVYGMERADPDHSPSSKSPQLSRKNSTEIIIPPAREGSRAGKNVPHLDLKEVIVDSPVANGENKSDGVSEGKQRVKNMKELGRCVSQKPAITSRLGTGRTTGSSASNAYATRARFQAAGFNDDASTVAPGVKVPLADDTHPAARQQKTQSLLPRILAQQSHRPDLFDEKKSYSEEAMWNMVKAVSPALYGFALQHNLTIEEVEEYADLMQKLDIDPSVINEYVHQSSTQKTQPSLLVQGLNYLWGDLTKQNMERLAKEYEKIKKENPETYKEMVLEVMKAAADLEAGLGHGRSKIADTNHTLQSQQLDNQAATLRSTYLGILASILTAAGGWAFGIVGQIINPTNSTSTS
jgi:hypothetical protein